MPTVISGDTGIDKVQDGVVVTADLADGAVTPAKMSGAQSGSAPVYGARAWCVFDGTLAGPITPAAAGNVTNITKNGTGDYTINFTTAMPDANYSVVGTAMFSGATDGVTPAVGPRRGVTAYTTSSVRIQVSVPSTGTVNDAIYVNVAIFR